MAHLSYLLLIVASLTINAQSFDKLEFELHNRGLINFYFSKQIDKHQILKDINSFQKSLKNLELFTGHKLQESIRVYIFKSVERKTLNTKNINRSHFNLDSKVIYTSSNEYSFLEHDASSKILILRLLIGTPRYVFLEEGLVTYLTPQWEGKGYRYWVAKFVRACYPISESDCFDAKTYLKHSPYIRKAFAALYVAQLLQRYRKADFLRFYRSSTIPRLKFSSSSFLDSNSLESQSKRAKPLPFLKGFNFAHEGYSVYNGYLGHLIIPALKALQTLHVNTVAIVPYTYMPSPFKSQGLNIPKRLGSETDETVIYSLHRSKLLGFMTLLKPQIWLSGSWTGEIAMTNNHDWQIFLDKYERWILHYAFLAARYKVDVFSLGVEMTKVSMAYPAFWTKLAAKVRFIYDGKITYSANWYQEFEAIKFWQDLDYVSINAYYPLSQDNNPTKLDLKQAFETIFTKLDQVAKRHQKPLLFTEIGFRSSEAPWKSPHSSPQSSNYRPDHQVLCYEVVCEVLKNKTYAGIYWWKWPSFLDYAQQHPLSFTPCGKEAENIIKNYFKP